jgi:ketosteroid isomerase-like protein
MSAEENANLLRELHQAFNERNYDRVDDLVVEDVEWENVATGETFSGPEGVKQFMPGWVEAFSDGKTEIQDVHAGDDFAVVEYAGRGTQLAGYHDLVKELLKPDLIPALPETSNRIQRELDLAFHVQ